MTALSRKKTKAIATLLGHHSIRKAAEAAGVGESTLFRWLRQDRAFKNAYREARRQAVQQAISRLQNIAIEAVSVLQQIMVDRNQPSSSRVACAKTILDTSLKAIELEDLAIRVEGLEALFDKRSINSRRGYTHDNA
jgi:transposase-like protein